MSTLVAKPNASQRTKTRIEQYGPEFTVENRKVVTTSARAELNGRECLLIRSDTWYGWLPADEVEVRS